MTNDITEIRARAFRSLGRAASTPWAPETVIDLCDEIAAKDALMKRMAEALYPFADAAMHLHLMAPDEGVVLGLSVRDWRSAYAAHAAYKDQSHD